MLLSFTFCRLDTCCKTKAQKVRISIYLYEMKTDVLVGRKKIGIQVDKQGETSHQRHTKIAADDILIFYFYLSKKIKLVLSSESSACRGFT